MLSLLMFAMALTLGALPSRGADSDAVYQAKKRVNDADAQVRKAMAGVTIEANRIAKAVEITPAWQQAMLELKSAQARQLKASAAVKTALAADPNYKKAVAERTRTFEEKETLLQDPKATPEQRTNAAIATLKAAADISKLEQQALEDDPEVAKAKAAITEQIEASLKGGGCDSVRASRGKIYFFHGALRRTFRRRGAERCRPR